MLHESEALRVARAVNHARATLMAGFTTVRDLGTEGAGYADVGLKQAINQGIIPGPRMQVVTRAIVVTGQYAPKGFATEYMDDIPQGAEEANGPEGFTRVVRDQIKHGADWIKIYADYRWGPNGETMPGPTQEEFNAVGERREELRPLGRRARDDRRRHASRGRWPASRRSSTATTGRRKSSSSWRSAACATCRRSRWVAATRRPY